MNTAILSLGSNSTDKEMQIAKCIEWLKRNSSIQSASSVYCTPATNGCGTIYSNAVVKTCTDLSREEYTDMMKRYERNCGRTPQSKLLGVIPIDIDVVIWNDATLRPKDFSQEYFTIGWNEINSNL